MAIVCVDGRSLWLIGIMGWFSGGSDAFDGVQDETGARFSELLVTARLL